MLTEPQPAGELGRSAAETLWKADAMWTNLVDTLRDSGVTFAAGLTNAEVTAAESQYGFRFPPDLREFLQAGMPRGSDFPD